MKPDMCKKRLMDTWYTAQTYCDEDMNFRMGDGLFSDGGAYTNVATLNLGMSDFRCV